MPLVLLADPMEVFLVGLADIVSAIAESQISLPSGLYPHCYPPLSQTPADVSKRPLPVIQVGGQNHQKQTPPKRGSTDP